MTAKKAVLQLSVHDECIRKKVFVRVSRFPGVQSITMDDKTGKMTVVGDVDVPVIVMKLRKICNAEIVTVEVVKPPEKKPDEPKKPDAPKPGDVVAIPINYPYQYQYQYLQYNPSSANSHYYHPYANSHVVVDEPNACVIM